MKAEIEIIRRDPTVPGLAVLLDPDAFLAALRSARPEAQLESARIAYVKYKPGTNCLTGYRLIVAGTPVDVYGKAYPRTAKNKLRRARDEPGVPGPLGTGRIVVEDSAVVVSVFPNDGKLPQLGFLSGEDERMCVLQQLLPDRRELWQAKIESLVYKPERRFVGCLVMNNTRFAALKAYTEREYLLAQHNAQAFHSSGPLQIAGLIGRSDSHRMLAFEWLKERPLDHAILDPKLDMDGVATAGAALAELHSQEPQGLACKSRQSEAAHLITEAEWLGLVLPEISSAATALTLRLAAQLEQEPALERPIHGDFHARQVLLGAGTVAILDLDRAVRGDPAADLGNFIAHLEREVVRGKLPENRLEPLKQALLDGYKTTRGAIPTRLELYIAFALFGLALRFFRYGEPDWAKKAADTIARAHKVANASPSFRPLLNKEAARSAT